MAITREQVEHVAKLARLKLSSDEVARLSTELGHILAHVDLLSEVDTTGVEPTEYLAVNRLPLREDRASPGVTHEQALDGSPQVLNEGFRVPAFVEG